MTLSRHCQTRMQQRGIPYFVLDTLLDYGEVKKTRSGESLVLDKNALRQLQKAEGKSIVRQVERWRGLYAVVTGDGTVVTVAHGYRRLKNR